MLSLLLVALLAVHSGFSQKILNLATIGEASQSTDFERFKASYAIDNDPNTFSHTTNGNGPWWQLDLKKVYAIQTVTITNRKDCCGERLGLYDVRVGNYSDPFNYANRRCVFTPHISQGATKDIYCAGVIGRYVSVSLPGRSEYLHLAEVKVSPNVPEDLAQIAQVSESSNYGSAYPAVNAIDGNVNTISHTLQDSRSWWRADLPKSFKIRAVKITNRVDCCGERLQGYEVRVGDYPDAYHTGNKKCPVSPTIPQGVTGTVLCSGLPGRYVFVTIPIRNEYLHLAEVKIIPESADNHAASGTASQCKDLSAAYSADRAIDGFTSSMSHTAYEVNPWLRIDLNEAKVVHDVAITNRIDCCGERLRGYEVFVGNNPDARSDQNKQCPYNPFVPQGRTGSAFCNGLIGRYVFIIIPSRSEHLQIQEVRVSSTPAMNVAQYGEARQSSDYPGHYSATNAIDNDPNTFSHTGLQYQPWWSLKFLNAYKIYNVLLRFRVGCCNNYLNGYEIQVGNYSEAYHKNNVKCSNAPMVNPGETAVIYCRGIIGKYLFVVLPGQNNYINIGDVEVNAIKC